METKRAGSAKAEGMVNVVRAAGGLTGGAAGVVSGFLAIYLAVVPPSDDSAKHGFIIAAAVICGIAIVGLVAFGIAEYIRDRDREKRDRERDERDREREKRDRERDDVLKNLLAAAATTRPSERVVVGAAEEPKPEQMLRQAALELAREIRAFLASIPADLSREQEHERTFAPFLQTFWPRLRDIKDRLENVVTPRSSVVSSVEWLPTDKNAVQKTADALEREALRVPDDVPL